MSEEKPPGVGETPALFDTEIEPAPPLTEEEEAALLEADVDVGRVVPHSEVRKWPLAVGTPDEFPMPESWLK